jgi:SAM-dependent methyltransferase
MGNLPGGLRFDLITCCNVFHHIQPIERPAAARMLRSRIKPGARLAIWEHNPLNPLTRVLVRLCPFDEHASLLSLTAARRIFEASAFRLARYAYVNFFPPGWQRLKWVSRLEKKLFRAPMGAQYWALFERDERGLDRLESI